jgi:hypothetical protein
MLDGVLAAEILAVAAVTMTARTHVRVSVRARADAFPSAISVRTEPGWTRWLLPPGRVSSPLPGGAVRSI